MVFFSELGFGKKGREIERKDSELVLWTNLTTVRGGIGFAFHYCGKKFGLLIIIIIINLINNNVKNYRNFKSFGFIYIYIYLYKLAHQAPNPPPKKKKKEKKKKF